jgi:hypothetical protein
MLAELSKALDECLARMGKGESLESCLNDYPHLRSRLWPLLSTAAFVSTVPRVSPSDEFRVASRARLKVRLLERSGRAWSPRPRGAARLLSAIETVCKRLIEALNKPLPLAVPISLLLLLAAGGSISIIATVGFPAQPSALASQCTFSVLSGSAEVQLPGSDTWQEAVDGSVLAAGTRVKTASDSYAMLTFFEGSSLKLEPGTDVEISRIEGAAGRSTDIVLKQWLGRTWSRVVKKLDAGTRYEIQTPSAHALVRGTLFEIEVDETSATTVRTIEGLVSVFAQNEEVFLPAGQETNVEPGMFPSEPRPIGPPANEILITVSMPAVASVVDPTGSSAGYLPDGFAFNQISGSRSSSPHNGAQVIRIPNPVPGRYSLVLRSVGDGTSQISLAAFSEGQIVSTHAASHDVASGSEWLVPFNITFEGGRLVRAEVGDIEPLNDRSPEKLVRFSAPASPTASPESLPETPQPLPSIGNYTLTVVSSNGGSVTQPGQGVFRFHAGSRINLVAKADDGWVFDHWTGDVEDASSAITTTRLSEPQAVTAIFVRLK